MCTARVRQVRSFTQRLEGFCHTRGITLVDPYEVSRGTHSYDGTHYGMELNVLLAHILLNFLSARRSRTHPS